MSMSERKKNAIEAEKDVTLYLSDIARGFQKFWWLSLLLAVLLGGVVLVWGKTHFVPQYKSSATYTILTQNETLYGGDSQSAYSFSYSRLTAGRLALAFQYASQSAIVQRKICEELECTAMPAQLAVEFAEGTNLMTITASGKNPRLVQATVLSFIRHYSEVTNYITGPTKLVTISEPVLPLEPYNARKWQVTALYAAAVGFFLGIAWIVVYALLRQTIRSKADIRRELNQTCIGVLPKVTFKRRNRLENPKLLLSNPSVDSDFLEAIRLLRHAVQNGLREEEKILLITSTAPGEGKTIVTLNLAAILAKNDKRILVVDTDTKASGIKKLLSDEESVLMEEILPMAPIHCCRRRYIALGFDVLTFDGGENPLRQSLKSDPLRELLECLRTQYDLILIDTPPCGMVSDTAIAADAADAALYVVQKDTVLTARILNGIHTLLSTDIRLIGCVMNGASTGVGRYGYGRYRKRSYYGKYSGSLRDEQEEKVSQ